MVVSVEKTECMHVESELVQHFSNRDSGEVLHQIGVNMHALSLLY